MSLLPDCEVEYHGAFLTRPQCAEFFDSLTRSYDLLQKTISMADGTVFESQLGCFMFADPELTGFESLPEVWGGRAAWPPVLEQVKADVEKIAGRAYQVCRCLHYACGQAGVGFHADLPAYGCTASVASLSLGAERQLVFRRKEDYDQTHSLILEAGSLLIMGEGCQDRYEHSIPLDETCRDPRLNLTFRQFGWG